ncbi:MAG: glutathione transferase GstA [Candidatus Berkiella sp.]
MRLYYSPGACSLAPHIALAESQIKYDLEKVDLKSKKTEKGADFLQINPKGYVPCLALEDGDTLTEVAVILQCIADLSPDKALLPAFPSRQRYHALEWLNFISSEMHKKLGMLFHSVPEDYKKVVLASFAKRCDFLSEALNTGPYLMGEQFGVIDAYCFTILTWTKPLKFDLTAWPNVLAYLKRVRTRPSVIEALKEEGLTP